MTMLELESTRWGELTQTYGTAEDIPRLLEALASVEGSADRAELWFGVWATLRAEGQVCSAAYAAVPHLLEITRERAFAERVSAIHVAVEVECARHVAGAPRIPDDLVEAYAAAVESLPGVVCSLTAQGWDSRSAQILAAALLVGQHQPVLARTIMEG